MYNKQPSSTNDKNTIICHLSHIMYEIKCIIISIIIFIIIINMIRNVNTRKSFVLMITE